MATVRVPSASARSLPSRISEALADTAARAARSRGFGIIRPRAEALADPEFAGRLRAMKLAALADNRRLVTAAVESLEANGIKVFVAADASQAVEYVAGVFAKPGLVVKSKSNMGKELHLAAELSQRGHTVIETDLGDRINQLGGTEGAHVLAPAVSVGRESIRGLFSREAGEELPDDTAALVAAARRSLRHYLESADYGLTGANAVAADTGTICLMENEGNIRAATSLPRVHVAVAGIHKVVPTLEDAVRVTEGASRFGAGQVFGTYLSLISGPGDGVSGPEEVHLVLVDDGRSAYMDGPYREAFACINCGSCLNQCPTYAELGDAYGAGHRVGGVGTLQTALLDGVAVADADGASLCIGCGKCVTTCPVSLDTPGLLDRLKDESGLSPAPVSARLMMAAVEDRGRLRWLGRVARAWSSAGPRRAARASGLLRLSKMEEAERLLPAEGHAARLPAETPARGRERAQVLFFRGCLMDELMGPVHEDCLAVLSINGCRVSLPEGQACCGALHEHGGRLEAARALARRNIDAFGGDSLIVTDSGGCGAFLKGYGELLADEPEYADRARVFAARVRDVDEFLAELGLVPPPPTAEVTVAYHDSCHLALVQGVKEQPRALLDSIPGVRRVEMAPGEACCGSGGIWSLRHPDVASSLRDNRLERFHESGADVLVSNNPGCLLHLGDDGQPAMHLVQVLARAYEGRPVGPGPDGSAAHGASRASVVTSATPVTTSPAPSEGSPALLQPPGDLVAEAMESLARGGWHVHRCADAGAVLGYVSGLLEEGQSLVLDGSAEGALEGADVAAWIRRMEERGVAVVGADRSLVSLAPHERRAALLAADVGVTGASSLAARTGSVFLAEEHGWGRLTSNLPYRHVVVARTDCVVADLDDGVARVAGPPALRTPLPRYVSGISGPSRTGDIDMEIVQGMHGPGEVHLVLIG